MNRCVGIESGADAAVTNLIAQDFPFIVRTLVVLEFFTPIVVLFNVLIRR